MLHKVNERQILKGQLIHADNNNSVLKQSCERTPRTLHEDCFCVPFMHVIATSIVKVERKNVQNVRFMMKVG